MGPMAVVNDRSFSIGRVIGRAFGAMSKNPVVILGLSLVLSGIPSGLFSAYFRQDTGQLFGSGFNLTIFLEIAAGLLVAAILHGLVVGCVTRSSIAYSEREQASVGDCLSVALSRWLPVFGAGILMTLGICVGTLLLFVPGLMFLCMWAVIIPVIVAENSGVIAAFTRSAQLTRGARWNIFGLVVIVWLIVWGIDLLGSLVSRLTLGMSYTNPAIATQTLPIILSIVITTLTTAISSCKAAALFIELRNWKDGPQDSKLSEIFA